MGGACVSNLLFYSSTHPLCYNHPKSKPSTSLCTAGVSGDFLGCYLLELQQDQAELGPTLCKVQTSGVCRYYLILYTLTVSIKGRGGHQSAPQPNLPKVMPCVSSGARESPLAEVWPTHLLPPAFWYILECSQIFTGRIQLGFRSNW